jgi:hypothetical protein
MTALGALAERPTLFKRFALLSVRPPEATGQAFPGTTGSQRNSRRAETPGDDFESGLGAVSDRTGALIGQPELSEPVLAVGQVVGRPGAHARSGAARARPLRLLHSAGNAYLKDRGDLPEP